MRLFVRIFQARRPHRLAVPLGFAGKWTPPRYDGQLAPLSLAPGRAEDLGSSPSFPNDLA